MIELYTMFFCPSGKTLRCGTYVRETLENFSSPVSQYEDLRGGWGTHKHTYTLLYSLAEILGM